MAYQKSTASQSSVHDAFPSQFSDIFLQCMSQHQASEIKTYYSSLSDTPFLHCKYQKISHWPRNTAELTTLHNNALSLFSHVILEGKWNSKRLFCKPVGCINIFSFHSRDLTWRLLLYCTVRFDETALISTENSGTKSCALALYRKYCLQTGGLEDI